MHKIRRCRIQNKTASQDRRKQKQHATKAYRNKAKMTNILMLTFAIPVAAHQQNIRSSFKGGTKKLKTYEFPGSERCRWA